MYVSFRGVNHGDEGSIAIYLRIEKGERTAGPLAQLLTALPAVT